MQERWPAIGLPDGGQESTCRGCLQALWQLVLTDRLASGYVSGMAAAAEVAKSLKQIRGYYDLGARVPDTKYGATKSAAERLKLNVDSMRACRRFRMQYTPAQLQQLCKACQVGEYPIGWTRVLLLLTVPDATQREALIKQAIRGKWSKSQLQAEIRRRYGRRAMKGAGRPTKLDTERSPESAYDKGLELCMKFESYMAALRREDRNGKAHWSQLPSPTKARIKQAEDAMEGAGQSPASKSDTPLRLRLSIATLNPMVEALN